MEEAVGSLVYPPQLCRRESLKFKFSRHISPEYSHYLMSETRFTNKV